jgi:hypothetical protein
MSFVGKCKFKYFAAQMTTHEHAEPSRVDAKRLFYVVSGEAKRLFRRKPNGIPE